MSRIKRGFILITLKTYVCSTIIISLMVWGHWSLETEIKLVLRTWKKPFFCYRGILGKAVINCHHQYVPSSWEYHSSCAFGTAFTWWALCYPKFPAQEPPSAWTVLDKYSSHIWEVTPAAPWGGRTVQWWWDMWVCVGGFLAALLAGCFLFQRQKKQKPTPFLSFLEGRQKMPLRFFLQIVHK